MGRLSELLKPGLEKALAVRGKAKAGAKPAGKPTPAGADARVWNIVVDAAGWRIIDDCGEPNAAGKAELPLAMRDQNEPLKNLEAAIAALGPEVRQSSPALHIMVSDPQIEVLDNRLIRGGLGDRESAAKLAREVLGRDESAFDVCDFGQKHHGDAERKIIAAVPLDRIREYLLAAGDLAITVRSISPVAAPLVADTDAGEAGRGLLEIGVRQCQIILADTETGAIVQRVIPVGVADMAGKLADAQSMSLDDAMAMLGERDFFARLPVGTEQPDGQPSRSEGAILTVATALLRDLTQTIDDFSENRMADAPQQLSLCGVGGEVLGLVNWLQRGLQLSLAEPQNHAIGSGNQLNLLRGTTEALVVRGKTRYRFQGDRFMPVEDDGAEERARISAAERASGKSKDGKKAGKPTNAARNRRAMALAGVAASGLLCMLVWDYLLAPAEAQTRRTSGALAATVDRSLALQSRLDEMIESHAQTLKVRNQANNKILWTEKFLAISDAIPAGLWLTDTAIIQDERSIGTTDVITSKLRIRGRTVLDERTNLADIATLIQGLEADQRFMSDFRKVTFEGMAPAGDGTLRFEVHAWYDQNKRKNAAIAEEEKSGGAIGKLRQTTNARARTQDELLNLNPQSVGQNQ